MMRSLAEQARTMSAPLSEDVMANPATRLHIQSLFGKLADLVDRLQDENDRLKTHPTRVTVKDTRWPTRQLYLML